MAGEIPGYSKHRPYGEHETRRVGNVMAKVYLRLHPKWDYSLTTEYRYLSSDLTTWVSAGTNYNNIPYIDVGDLYNWWKVRANRVTITRVDTGFRSFDDSLEEKLGGEHGLLGG